MKRPQQSFGFKQSHYERPNQKWLCGHAADGQGCPLGPDARGQCRAACECVPVRKGDRWHCARPESASGACADGPLPDGTCCRPIPKCTPARSLRARRGLLTGLTAAFTGGFLLFLWGGSARWDFFSPGPLASPHALSDARCTDCHAADGARLAAAGNGATADHHGGSADSGLCLNCHNLGADPLQPHGQTAPRLAGLTKKASQTPRAAARPVALAVSAFLLGGPEQQNGELACATCHQEHHGKDFDLRRLSNAQCQVCHARQFASLARGHPEFSDYPFGRRTRIEFDHVSHIERHFQDAATKAKAPASCTGCHETDAAGRTMLANNFAAACAGCHAEQIEGAGRADARGIAFLRVPGLDVKTLEKRGLRVGDWPEFAEGKPTPFMELLLSRDTNAAGAWQKLAGLDLLDLADAKDDELQATAQWGWAVKELFFDLVTRGQTALRERLQSVLPRPISNPQQAALAAQLPVDALLAAQQEWFANLLTEVPLHRSGGQPAGGVTAKPDAAKSFEPPAKTVAPEAWVAGGGWYRSKEDYTLRYRPAGHADAFLRGWLDLTGGVGASSGQTAATNIFKALSSPQGPGLCAKCHSIDAQSEGAWQMNWFPARPLPGDHPFTRFSHAAHFSLLDQKGCLTCHTLDPKANYQKSFENNFQPAVFTGNFRPMPKSVCASCHTARAAGDSCLKCHNYHVGGFAATLSAEARRGKLSELPALNQR